MSILVKKPKKDAHMREKYKRYADDFTYIQDNMRRLTQKYLKKYIAVKNQKVVYVADSMEEMVETITSDNEMVSDYIIEYLQEDSASCLF